MSRRTCTKCHKEYPATREYFTSDKRAPDIGFPLVDDDVITII